MGLRRGLAPELPRDADAAARGPDLESVYYSFLGVVCHGPGSYYVLWGSASPGALHLFLHSVLYQYLMLKINQNQTGLN